MPHPWFGEHRLTPAAPVDRIRETLRTETADIGCAPQSVLPAVPFAIPRSSYAELFRAADALLDLLRRTVLEIAPTAQGRMAAYGATDRDYPLFGDDVELEERYAHCMARPDVVIGPDGPRFLEFNVSGGMGGPVELHCLYQAWRKLYERSGGDLPFSFHDPFASRAALFADVCDELALPPRLAWVGTVRDLKHTDSTRYFDVEIDYLAKRGLTARHFEPEDVEQLWSGRPDLRYRVGLRHFTVSEWEELGISTDPVRQALKNGCLLLAPQTAELVANKLAMGMVSEGRPWMSSAERALVDRYLPWTRILTDRSTTCAGKSVELLAHAVRHRETLVLKQGIGLQGKQVVLGRDTDPEQWQSLVERAAALGDSIVQEYVPPQSYPLSLTHGSGEEPHEVEVAPVFSPFVFGGRAGGLWARFFATGDSGIVSVDGFGALDNAVVAV